ncbi:MAG: tRNA lysidine(34) synthetase TilS [Firmicutes bacterium]|nr:tRNA lysidine(34) synthetase TilS [Bacillota bacterium]
MGGAFANPQFDILLDVVKTIRRYNMLKPRDGVVVGVSGGIDSTALLHVLWRLQKEWELRLYIAHLNHGIRGEAADKDAQLVEAVGEKLGIPVFVETLDIPARARATGLTEEEAGRIARYGLYERLADQVEAQRIALGHHGDDQAETVLMNLIRGAGLRGLAGMPSVRDRVIRPLIELEKWRLEAYCQSHDLPWREDATNLSTEYRRNYIRWEIIPRMKQLNPAVVPGLMRTAAILSEDWQLLEKLSIEAYEQSVTDSTSGRIALSLPVMLALPTALRKRVIDHAYCRVSHREQGLPGASLEHLEKCIQGNSPSWRWTLPGNIDAFLQDEVLILARRVKIKQEKGLSPCILPLGSRTMVEESNLLIHTEILSTIPAWWKEDSPLQPRNIWQELGVWWADMDLASLELPLYVRSRRPGDRFQPLGMSGSKKLQDLFVDEKIPRGCRDQIPCIVDAKGILAVVGLHQANRTRITEKTQQVLRITVEKAETQQPNLGSI